MGSRLPENPETFAKVTAATQVAGGLLLATGRMPRLASAALAATVLPANLGAHMFWSETDPVSKARKRRDFMTDLSLLGGLIIASADTAGKPSLSWRGRRAARRMSEAVTVGLAASAPATNGVATRVGHGLKESLKDGAHRGQEIGHDIIEAASTHGAPLVVAARKRGEAALETTREHGGKLAHDAKSEVRRLAR